MASVWNFIKRHRGKLVAGGAVAGGAYVVHRYVTEHREEIETWFRSSWIMQPSETSDDLHRQAQKHFVFDSNQRTCDDAFLQLIPTIEDRLKTLLNVEQIAAELQSGRVTVKSDQIKLWDSMKEASLLRVVCSMSAYVILMVSMRAQMCILASRMLQSNAQSQLSWSGLVMDKVLQFTGISNGAGRSSEEDAGSQQVFLQSLQYFTAVGIERLVDGCRPLVHKIVSNITLQERLSEEKLKDLMGQLRLCVITNNFSYFVVPLEQINEGSNGDMLSELLSQLKSVLDSSVCCKLMDSLMDKVIGEYGRYCLGRCPQLVNDTQNSACTVAKQIPVWTDFFNHLSVSDNILSSLLTSQSLHEFAVRVFEKDPAFTQG